MAPEHGISTGIRLLPVAVTGLPPPAPRPGEACFPVAERRLTCPYAADELLAFQAQRLVPLYVRNHDLALAVGELDLAAVAG